MRTRVKICGIRTPEAALAAAEGGADAIGLVFYARSPRAIESAKAARLIAGLPPFVTTVGLFVNPSEEEVRAVLDQVPLDMLQFHGNETDAFCSLFGRPYLKALGVGKDFSIEAAVERYPNASALLLDTHDPVLHGGTGRSFDWSRFPDQSDKPLLLAGGLRPDNVRAAILQTRPYGVDVSGGVEISRGEKSTDLIRAFLREVMHEHATGF